MLRAENLTKRFGSLDVVSNVSFAVRAGAVTGFLGPNGAGKTTTLRLFLELVHPTSGSALIDGRPLHEWPAPGRKVGAVLDGHCAHPGRRAIDSVRWAARLAGAGADAEGLLGRVGLAEAAGRRTGAFSRGMLQRLALAIALAGDPEIVILDEPMNGLDAENMAWIKTVLRGLRDEGRTVFIASRLLAELEDLVDDLVVIAQGNVVGSGSAGAFIDRFQPQAVSVLSDQPQALGIAVSRAGGQILDTNGQRVLISGLTSIQLDEIAHDAGIALFGVTEESGPSAALSPDLGPAVHTPVADVAGIVGEVC
ncbi:ATP-binding cassette domain-containing protein [Nonomuraea sp. NPDC049695]|uniref:ABC transporter ATP-binding protein n=1 Tax=Nonomuraea sp. NPDC049695 TaxID=3154734 RepID=UPI003419E433